MTLWEIGIVIAGGGIIVTFLAGIFCLFGEGMGWWGGPNYDQ